MYITAQGWIYKCVMHWGECIYMKGIGVESEGPVKKKTVYAERAETVSPYSVFIIIIHIS
jgi:hypothetical protein